MSPVSPSLPRCIKVGDQAIRQYISRYAEGEAALLHDFPTHVYDHCIVIPCFRETPDFAKRLLTGPLRDHKVLVIVVINQNHVQPEPFNEALLEFFSSFTLLWHNRHLQLRRGKNAAVDWLVVNRCHPPLLLPVKQGVGLARKIGCDLAVALAAQGVMATPWLHTTDADAHLPSDYLNLPGSSYVAAVYDFTHIQVAASASEWEATQLYEQALRYYIAGLRWAGSPYCQHPIGSLLAFTVRAYCETRGFPKRSAGEDFYLLNKLSKLGPVFSSSARVKLEARTSDRVPFGTGPKVSAIAQLENPATDFLYYSATTFVELKAWLDTVPAIWQALQNSSPPLAGLSVEAQSALHEAGIEKLWPHLRKQTRNAHSCEHAIHTWFDAFQTLKFIRRLQAQAYPPRPLQQCLREAPFSC